MSFMSWIGFDLTQLSIGFACGYFWTSKVWPWLKQHVSAWWNKPAPVVTAPKLIVTEPPKPTP